MRVLLTGSAGYVGSVVGGLLEAAGHDVVGLDTALYDGCDLAPLHAPAPDLRLDIRDVERRHLEGFDAVVHLAALSNDPIGELDGDLTGAINHRATVTLAEAARAAGVERFIFASSCSMYGAAGGSDLIGEDAPLAPLTAYAVSKVRSEKSLAELLTDDFTVTSLRFATAYGVSPRLRLDIVLNNLVGWAITTGAVRLQSDGMAWRPLIHVEDMGSAIQAVLEAPREHVHGEAFNAGTVGANFLVRDLALVVAEAVGGVEVEFAADASPDLRSYRVDFSKIAETLDGFRPAWDPTRGAQQLVAAYRAAGMDEELFRSDRFTRLLRIRTLQADGRLDGSLRWTADDASPERTTAA